MRYAADIRSVLAVILTLSALIPAAVASPGWNTILIVPVMTWLAFICCIVTHNHMHSPIFESEHHNRLFNIFIALAKGHTVQTVVVPHNLNHHVFHGADGDWIAVGHAGHGRGWQRLMRYVLRSVVMMNRQRIKDNAPSTPPEHRRAMREQRTVILIFVLFVLASNPAGLLLHVLLPWTVAMLMLVAVNLLQHDGCELMSPVNRARNFTSRFGNFFLFNNGYHMIHHRYPSRHWSLLKELHENEILPLADPRFQEASLLRFLIRNYFMNDHRLARVTNPS